MDRISKGCFRSGPQALKESHGRYAKGVKVGRVFENKKKYIYIVVVGGCFLSIYYTNKRKKIQVAFSVFFLFLFDFQLKPNSVDDSAHILFELDSWVTDIG